MLSPCLLAGRGAVHGRYFLWSFLNQPDPGLSPSGLAHWLHCTAKGRSLGGHGGKAEGPPLRAQTAETYRQALGWPASAARPGTARLQGKVSGAV